jgi:hypothetical protein
MADNNKVKRPKIRTFYAASKGAPLGALDISFNSKDGAVYFKFAPQTAYHADRRAKGEYGWRDSINIKLDVGEVGAIIRSLRIDGEYTFVHDFEGNKTTGGVKFYTSKNGSHGFGFYAKKGDREIKVPVQVGDGELILEYLRFCLDHIFSADYALEKAYWKSVAERNANGGGKQPEVDTQSDNTGDSVEVAPVAAGASEDDNPF